MTKIILTRHGHVEGIKPERFRGRTELPLTELGMKQALATARRISTTWRPICVYTSPMGRCIATGQAIAEAAGIGHWPIEDLNDLDFGRWQWKTHAEVDAEAPQLFALWNSAPHLVRFPDGDSLQDLMARVAEALRFVLGQHPDKVVVLVSHDSVNRALLLSLLELPVSAYWRLAQDPCAINEIDVIDGKALVLSMNDTCHLAGL
jgi:broad specificity phosphatase PhoE